jgi:type I restriction-modification system DNA methylase subunit
VSLPASADRARAIIEAMESIEADYDTLRGTLPKSEYQELDNGVLGQLLRSLNPDELKKVSGDVFGRIYEYFLTQFADQKAHDGGEFFTPISLVSLIAHVLDPERGRVLDPACGSGGMFVQSARIVEEHGGSPTEKLTFYGLEKNATTIRLAKMNLAVHGLEGDIQKAITYYEDPHELAGKADYVMANPPFNVDEIDADKVQSDPRLPFGLPGVNKKGKVSNGNYVWISYFYNYLSERGRAGFVMSSQASSAGNTDARVRRRLVETGDVDIMIAIRSNFFYTRTVPCELWFIDRGKPDQPSTPALLPGGEGSWEHYRGGFDFSGLVERARELRRQQTPAEALFWELVRDRRCLGLKFRRQHQLGDYILDFYSHDVKIAVELDGSVHEKRKKRDSKRDAYLKSQGIQVIRIPNGELINNPEKTLKMIASKLPSPVGRRAGDEGRFSGPLNRRGQVLMVDARNIYRKVTRKIYDFSPEQQQNLLAIVWLYRGQTDRFLQLIGKYLANVTLEAQASLVPLDDYCGAIGRFAALLSRHSGEGRNPDGAPARAAFTAAFENFKTDAGTYAASVKKGAARAIPPDAGNADLHQALEHFAPVAEAAHGLILHANQLYKLAGQWIEQLDANQNRDINTARKALDTGRDATVTQLKQVRYFWKQAHWLADRFPDAELRDVEGLVKLVSVREIEANDWSLTPGRYVGIAPEEEDEDFDFEETLREIHVELEGLNAEAVELAVTIKRNFEELGA